MAGKGYVHLPTDMPPSKRQQLQRQAAGLLTQGSAGQAVYPMYSAPWAPFQSEPFPKSLPSNVAPSALKPIWVVAINAYSPVAHRNGFTLDPGQRVPSARGVGRPSQAGRPYAVGYVTRWPQSAPRWPSFGESPQAR